MKICKTTLILTISFCFSLIGIASVFVSAEKTYITKENQIFINGDEKIIQKFNPRFSKIKFSWRNPLTNKEK